MNKLLSRLGFWKDEIIWRYGETFLSERLQMEILSRTIKQNMKKIDYNKVTIIEKNEVLNTIDDPLLDIRTVGDPLLDIQSVSEDDKWFSLESLTPDLIKTRVKPMTDMMLSNMPGHTNKPVESAHNIETDNEIRARQWAKTAREKELSLHLAQTILERLIDTKDIELIEKQLKRFNILLINNPWLRDIQNISKPGVSFLKLLDRKAIRENRVELLLIVREVRVRLGSWPRDLVGSGVRVLAIDGGGMRGVVVLTVLRELEKYSGCKTHKMFDMIVGTSTGAVIASLLGTRFMSAGEALRLYKKFGHKIFSQTLIQGASQLFYKQSYYDAEVLERSLRMFCGQRTMMATALRLEVPAVSFVSSLVTKEQVQPHLFTNYMLPAGVQPTFPTSTDTKKWVALRASCAAPGYFPDMVLGGKVHQDGAIMANNPSHLALLESQAMWPGKSLHCLVSLGCGRRLCPGGLEDVPEPLTAKDKVVRVLDTISDTETVHHLLSGLLSPESYFRLNPSLSGELPDIDEIREDKLVMMERDVERYIKNNEDKVMCLVNRLSTRTEIQDKFRKIVVNLNI